MRISEDRLSALAESPGSATLWEVRIMRLEILAARAEIGQLTAERDSESRWAKEYLARAENAERELARVQPVIEAARRGLAAVGGLIDDSRGVVGVALNGDEAPWDELLAGGRFEMWLLEFSAAQGAFLDYDVLDAAKEPKP